MDPFMESLMDPLIDSLMDPLMEALMNPSMEALISQKFHLPCQDASCPKSLMMESRTIWGSSWWKIYVQDTQLDCTKNFCKAPISSKLHLPGQDAPHPLGLLMDSRWTGNHPDMSFHVQYTQLHDSNLIFVHQAILIMIFSIMVDLPRSFLSMSTWKFFLVGKLGGSN